MNTNQKVDAAVCEQGVHPIDEAAAAYGGRDRLAEAFKVTQGAVGNWKARGVPIKVCVQIERDVPAVTRRRLRPNDWAEIWPELAANDEAKQAPALANAAPGAADSVANPITGV